MSEFVKKLYKSTKRERTAIFDYVFAGVLTFAVLSMFNLMETVSVSPAQFAYMTGMTLLVFFLFHTIFRLYKTVWEFAVFRNFVKLAGALIATMLVSFGITVSVYGYELWYVSYFATNFFVCYTFLMLIRFVFLYIYNVLHKKKVVSKAENNNTMIIGAGWTGTAIAKELINNPDIFNPVCFLDDDFDKNNKEIFDIPVVGNTDSIQLNIKKYDVKKIIFAIPTCEKEKRRNILKECVDSKCVLKVVPPIQDLIDKSDVIPQTRDVRIEDLLGREPMTFDTSEVRQYVAGKVCLVTGGGGSIGSELCRQIASFQPKKLIILDIYENNAYDIQQELIRKYGSELDLEVEICSIADYDKCRILFKKFRPQLVFHAAAHKHVPLMETVPEQAIKNNVVGTLNLCRLAAEFKTQKFLLISTDKAVNPTNVMGASKRCCEMIVQYHSQICDTTTYCAVRFGNVLGSNGSVIPLFKRQIAEGGPVTITDKRIIRYFMTIPEAVSLVLETGALSQSGEIFVLDMGEPVRIVDLAENMISLSGLTLGKDIEIEYTGLRPGEKLFEELLLTNEGMRKTSNKKIFICKQISVDEKSFMEKLNKLIEYARDNKQGDVIGQLRNLIPNFIHKTNGSVDLERQSSDARVKVKNEKKNVISAKQVITPKQQTNKNANDKAKANAKAADKSIPSRGVSSQKVPMVAKSQNNNNAQDYKN